MIADLKPYADYQDSGLPWLRQIPRHWEARLVRHIGRLLKGVGGTKEDAVTEGMPCVRYGELYTTYQGFIHTTKTRISADKAAHYTPIYYGDVLFAASGEKMEEIGKSAVNLIKTHAVCGGDVIILRPNVQIHAPFLGYALDTYHAVHQKATMGRGTTIKHIYPDELRGLGVFLPPPDEQAAIVRFLDHANRRIQRYIRAKQRLLDLIVEELMCRVRIALNAPETRHERLGSICSEFSRPVDRTSDHKFTTLGMYNRGRGIFHKPPLTSVNLGASTFYWVEPGDLVISGQFAWEGAVAMASEKERKTIISHRYYALRGRQGIVLTSWLLALLRSDYGAMLLNHHSRGAAGRNRPLNLKTLLKERVPVPMLSEQYAIDNFLKKTTPVRERVLDEINLLRELRTRLISDVVTGQLDVRAAAAALPDEPAEDEPIDEVEGVDEGDGDDSMGGEED
jgi:type I restriction enzyme S subunit